MSVYAVVRKSVAYIWMCVDVRRFVYLCNLYSMVIVIYFMELKF